MKTEITNDMLNIQSPVIFDNSVEAVQEKTFVPQSYANLNEYNQAIEIHIPASDAYYRPSDSYIQITGRLRRRDNNQPYNANAQMAFINNGIMYLFSNIKYQLGGTNTEQLNFPGHTSSVLGYLSYPDDFNTSSGLKQCWSKDTTIHANATKYRTSAAAPAAGFTPAENANYNQGFDLRRSVLLDNNNPGRFSFIIPYLVFQNMTKSCIISLIT